MSGNKHFMQRTWHEAVCLNFLQQLCVFPLYTHIQTLMNISDLLLAHIPTIPCSSGLPPLREETSKYIQVNLHQPVDTCGSEKTHTHADWNIARSAQKRVYFRRVHDLAAVWPVYLHKHLSVYTTCSAESMSARFTHHTKWKMIHYLSVLDEYIRVGIEKLRGYKEILSVGNGVA